MAYKTNTATKKAEKTEPKAPTYRAYHVTEGAEGQKARWSQIGAFFAHGDGEGGTLLIDLLPIGFDGRIVLRSPKEREQE